MRLLYPMCSWLAGMLLATSLPGSAQVPAAPDSVAPARWLVKAGLNVTSLRYSHTATGWQFQLPATFGFERRLSARYSGYGLLDTDWQLGSTARRRRSPGSSVTTTLPAVTVGVGGRLYYGQPAGSWQPGPGRPELGPYLALQAEATLERPAPANRSAYHQPASLTPALYVLWGAQNRWRPHLLADFSAGVGVLAPAHITGGEVPLTRHGWDVGLQASVRLYWAR